MPGSEKYFLTYNKDEIMKNLVAMEGHFRNVKPSHDAGDLSCIVKHAADAEGHSDEAVSHSLVAEGKEESRKFNELSGEIKKLRHKVQHEKVTAEEGIKAVRGIRGKFESFNPEYDVSKCKTCGEIDASEFVKRAENVLSGSVNEKNLYTRQRNYVVSDKKMVKTTKDIAFVYGIDLVAKGASIGTQMLDVKYPKSFLGQDPSLVIDVVAAVLGVVGAMKLDEPYDDVALLVGGFLTTDLVQKLANMVTVPAARFVPAPLQQGAAVPATAMLSSPVGRYLITS